MMSFTAPRVDMNEWMIELEKMSSEEKADALADLNGTKPVSMESPELVQSSIESLKAILEKESNSNEALFEAWIRIPEVANSDEFYLTFLRAVSFDAKVSDSNTSKIASRIKSNHHSYLVAKGSI
jgi:hypothetical protein